ncbi:MAG TPA: hypothetical protein VFD32_15190 [Dehalococcoidia bacterium]|nr:hypothetical protein [Dehalococcoidia bacterium]
MQRKTLSAIILIGCGIVLAGRTPPLRADRAAPAQTITYPPGWNLVSGPDGSTLSGAEGLLYTLQPGDSGYQAVPAGSALHGCWGYWAFFPDGGSLNPSADTADRCDVPTLPGQWVMLGNPTATQTLSFSGIDQALSYSPESGYQVTQELAPGQGAFASGQRELVLGAIAPTMPTVVLPNGAPQPQPLLTPPPGAATPPGPAITPPPSSSPLPRPRLTPPPGYAEPASAQRAGREY